MLKIRKLNLNLFQILIYIYIFLKEGTRDGISYISNRYSKGNNKYFKSYDLKQEPNILCTWMEIIYIVKKCYLHMQLIYVKRLMSNFFDKGKYVLHYENSIMNTLIMQL